MFSKFQETKSTYKASDRFAEKEAKYKASDKFKKKEAKYQASEKFSKKVTKYKASEKFTEKEAKYKVSEKFAEKEKRYEKQNSRKERKNGVGIFDAIIRKDPYRHKNTGMVSVLFTRRKEKMHQKKSALTWLQIERECGLPELRDVSKRTNSGFTFPVRTRSDCKDNRKRIFKYKSFTRSNSRMNYKILASQIIIENVKDITDSIFPNLNYRGSLTPLKKLLLLN